MLYAKRGVDAAARGDRCRRAERQRAAGRRRLVEQLKIDPKNAGKPEEVLNKIIEGRLNKFYEDNVLIDQPFVKDPAKTVGELVAEKIASIKENISIRRFARFKLGESGTSEPAAATPKAD